MINKYIILLILFFLQADMAFGANNNGKKEEIPLFSIYEKEDYNHCNYYVMLDTIQSKINIYLDSYGEYSRLLTLYICPDSSIVYDHEVYGRMRFSVKDGLVRKVSYQDYGEAYNYVYDSRDRLVGVRNGKYNYDRCTLVWRCDTLTAATSESLYPGNVIAKSTERMVKYDSVCSSVKSFELFSRLYRNNLYEILFAVLGLYGDMPNGSNSYTVVHKCYDKEYIWWEFETKVRNVYSESGTLLATTSFKDGHEKEERYSWYFDNLKKVFNYTNKATTWKKWRCEGCE